MRPPAKTVSAGALRHNYRLLKALCPHSRILAVVKCDAYGHGLARVARALPDADGFAVAGVGEGLALRRAGVGARALALQGFLNADELRAATAAGLDLAVHAPAQLDCLEQHDGPLGALWIKFDSGMRRLGFDPADADAVLARVARLPAASVVLMSHFACADDPADASNARQWRVFESLRARADCDASIANSAACMNMPNTRLQWVRAGLAVYGVAPPGAEHAAGLRPAMRVTAPVVAVRQCRAGDRVGYGGAHVCPRDTRLAVVAAGYGDGYPRAAAAGAPVWLAGGRRKLAGRVSMDMLTVALEDNDRVAPGDVAELWGPRLPVGEVAAHCNALPYELLCAAAGMRAAPDAN